MTVESNNVSVFVRRQAEQWLATAEAEMGYRSIAKLMVSAADCCRLLGEQGSEQTNDAVRLVLARTELGKRRIANIVFSGCELSEKQQQMDDFCRDSFAYFEDILAQN